MIRPPQVAGQTGGRAARASRRAPGPAARDLHIPPGRVTVITFRCGRCAGVVEVADGEAGRARACKRCGHTNVCPSDASDRSRLVRKPEPPVSQGHPLRLIVGAVALLVTGWAAWSMFDGRSASAAPPVAVSPADQRQRELLKENLGQPGDPLLGQEYMLINTGHFRGRLPALPVRWEPRLAEVGELAAWAFTLEGMFGHIGGRAMILLNPSLQADTQALRRALCHEMVHAYLYATGDPSTKHGPAFRAVLRRLSEEGAFSGIIATDDERAALRTWLEDEAARLDTEHEAMLVEAADIERERAEVEALLADLNARIAAAAAAGVPGPSQREVDAVNLRREAYNHRVVETNDRAARDRADLAHFNQQVERYNLMVLYPDGMDEEDVVKPRTAPARRGS